MMYTVSIEKGYDVKTYRGYVEDGIPRVTVRDERRPVRLAHHRKFAQADAVLNWGDDEGLSRDLARSILLDAFGVTTCNDIECLCESKWVEPVYDQFNAEVVSKFKPNEEWRIKQYDVCDFAFERRVPAEQMPVLEPTA